jgi:hypothetical protein
MYFTSLFKTTRSFAAGATVATARGTTVALARPPKLHLYQDSAGGSYIRLYRRVSDAEVNQLELLAATGVIDLDVSPMPDEDFRATEMAWLAANHEGLTQRYPGQWIAVDGPGLVAHASDLPTLMQAAAAAGHPDPFITAIPGPSTPQLFVG